MLFYTKNAVVHSSNSFSHISDFYEWEQSA